MYSSDDLKSLSDYLRVVAQEALKTEPPLNEDHDTLMALVRQLEAIRFNPLLFKSILKKYKVGYALMEVPLKRVALHINDAGALSKALVTWRCSNAK